MLRGASVCFTLVAAIMTQRLDDGLRRTRWGWWMGLTPSLMCTTIRPILLIIMVCMGRIVVLITKHSVRNTEEITIAKWRKSTVVSLTRYLLSWAQVKILTKMRMAMKAGSVVLDSVYRTATPGGIIVESIKIIIRQCLQAIIFGLRRI